MEDNRHVESQLSSRGRLSAPKPAPAGAPSIGIWGLRRRNYLRKHHDGLYTGLLLSGKLNAHLEEVDRSANEMFELLMKQYAAREGVTEELKASNQMEWVQRMDSIRERVEEIINTELICNESGKMRQVRSVRLPHFTLRIIPQMHIIVDFGE